jgi:phosphate/sulfate permease
MQVFSAICVIFSHGAGEVGYMTGPLGAVWQVRRRHGFGVLWLPVPCPTAQHPPLA